MRFSLLLGPVSFIGGFVGPLIFSRSNLGPLLGIFVTGPAGMIVGVLLGVLWSTQRSLSSLSTELVWLALAWLVTLPYTLFGMQFGFGWVGALLEALAVGCAYWLFLEPAIRGALPALIRPLAPPILGALLLMLVMTIFPPAIAPWWGRPQPGSKVPPPTFAFILDSRFDASQHVPELAVDRTALVREWLGTSALAVAICLLLAVNSKRRREERLT
jgi:hypothetical protein